MSLPSYMERQVFADDELYVNDYFIFMIFKLNPYPKVEGLAKIRGHIF